MEFNPHYAEAYYNLANILKEQKKFDEAVEAYHRVIELQPSYAEAYYNLANITSDLGKFDDEITSYRQAV
ncbi:MAG: tetratricopeptide repeat protein [Nitrospinota bacterium]